MADKDPFETAYARLLLLVDRLEAGQPDYPSLLDAVVAAAATASFSNNLAELLDRRDKIRKVQDRVAAYAYRVNEARRAEAN